MAQRSTALLLCLAWLMPAAATAATPAASVRAIDVSPARVRATPGERLEFQVRSDIGALRAVLIVPGGGTREVATAADAPGVYRLHVQLPAAGAGGLYRLHVWAGDARQPAAVGKAAILAGPIVMDFFLPAYLDREHPQADLSAYLDDFQSLGGNTLIAHAIITPDRAYFPSRLTRTAAAPGSPGDVVGRLMAEADRRGLAVFLSVSWDMTRQSPYGDRMREIQALMDELYALYAGHPALAGFYSYQEGSGTYYVPYVRAFTAHVKQLNRGLLSACAPFVDDPLVAGYLSTVDTLDVLIFQAQVMASYRPDNRKEYPLRRARDFAALGIGAKWLQDKIAVTHVELFGYLENRPDPAFVAASYENIFGQIASVSTAAGADGIALFAYHPHIWAARRDPRAHRSRQAVVDGLAFFLRVQRDMAGQTNPLAIYVPYSDWVVERWTVSILPALDGFRRAGIPVDILPYAPPLDESEYPYFPFHMNAGVLERLLSSRRVLVLPDISGFQQTDSDLIDAFVRRGGALVAFGPQIPMGRSFDRDRLFGGRETGAAPTGGLHASATAGRRTPAGASCALPAAKRPVWTSTSARVLATFEDGSPAILENSYGTGVTFAVLASAGDISEACAPLMRDVLDRALAHARQPGLTDVDGLTERSDVATARTGDRLDVALVNHDASPRHLVVRSADARGAWADSASVGGLEASVDDRVSVEVPAGGVRFLERRPSGGRQK